MPQTLATHARPRLRAALRRALPAAGACLAISARVASGATFGAGGGLEWSTGPGEQSTASASAYGSLSGRRASVALGALRFDDHLVGPGAGALAAIAFQPRAEMVLRASGARHIGDGAFRGWRLKAGPEWVLPRESTLGLFYVHNETNLDGVARGGSLELAVPVAHRVTARAAGAHLRAGSALTSSQGTVGVSWSPVAGVELGADAGLARNGGFLPFGTGQGSQGGSGGGLGLPPGILPAAMRSSEPEAGGRFETAPTLGLALRVALP